MVTSIVKEGWWLPLARQRAQSGKVRRKPVMYQEGGFLSFLLFLVFFFNKMCFSISTLIVIYYVTVVGNYYCSSLYKPVMMG